MVLIRLLYHQRCLVVFVLYMITGTQWESLIPVLSDAYLLGILLLKKAIVVGALLRNGFFVSMDVTFREKEPYYTSAISTIDSIGRECENYDKGDVRIGSILIPLLDISQPDQGT